MKVQVSNTNTPNWRGYNTLNTSPDRFEMLRNIS